MQSEHSVRGILLLVCVGLLASCASQPPPPPPPQKEQQGQQQQEQAAPAEQASAQPQEPEKKPAPKSKPAPPAGEPAKPKPTSEGDAAVGKIAYAKKCAACHGEQGEGKAALAKMLKVELRPLTSSAVQAKSDEELRRDISKGSGRMKPVTSLSETDLTNLVAFIRNLK